MAFLDKKVIVTGSSSGIGAETAVHFAQQGACVVLTARGQQGLEATADRCHKEAGAAPEKVKIVVADVTKEDDVRRLVKTTIDTFGKLDVLVNNVGAAISGGFETTSVDDLDRMFNVNVRSAFMMSKESMQHLIETKGNIVNVSSIAGTVPLPYAMGLSMAKAALNQMTKCLAIELAPKGVRVNAVNPGAIATDIFTRPGSFVSDPNDLQDYLDRMAAIHPLQRIGDTNEVAQAILWLASDQASFTTGATLPVDGGRQATTWCPAPAKKKPQDA